MKTAVLLGAMLLGACLLAWVPAMAAGGIELKGGQAFSDPDATVPMPAGWKASPIEYEDWAKGADLAVSLDQHLYPLFLPFIQKFARERRLDISVKEGTCGISAGMVSRRAVDMAGYCCPPGPSDRLPGLTYHTVGIGPLAILVHPDNAVSDVSLAEVRRIFAGQVLSWKDVRTLGGASGADIPIRPIGRLHCKARPGHWRLILDTEDDFGANLDEVGAIEDMMRKVASQNGAIGYEATWNIYTYEGESKVKALNLGGVSPFDKTALAEGRYPLYRTYNLATWMDGSGGKPLARELLEYLLRQTGQTDMRFGMVPAIVLRSEGWKFRGNELIGEKPR
jgi:hypothetical protein